MDDALKPGDRAPDFTLSSTNGLVSLRELLDGGDRVVVAFYTEDGTPTCASELTVLSESQEMLREFGARIVAISADTPDSHHALVERAGAFPFPLASDAELRVAGAYGVIDEQDPRRSRRAVFVVERDGAVVLAIVPFQPANLSQVEAIFNALGAET